MALPSELAEGIREVAGLAGACCALVDQVLDEHVVPCFNAWLAACTADPWRVHCHNHYRLQFRGLPDHHVVTAFPAPVKGAAAALEDRLRR